MEEKRAQATTYLLDWRRRLGRWRLAWLGRDDASRRESPSPSSSSSPLRPRCSSAENGSDEETAEDPIMVEAVGSLAGTASIPTITGDRITNLTVSLSIASFACISSLSLSTPLPALSTDTLTAFDCPPPPCTDLHLPQFPVAQPCRFSFSFGSS